MISSKECPECFLRDNAREEPKAVRIRSNDEFQHPASHVARQVGVMEANEKRSGVPRPTKKNLCELEEVLWEWDMIQLNEFEGIPVIWSRCDYSSPPRAYLRKNSSLVVCWRGQDRWPLDNEVKDTLEHVSGEIGVVGSKHSRNSAKDNSSVERIVHL